VSYQVINHIHLSKYVHLLIDCWDVKNEFFRSLKETVFIQTENFTLLCLAEKFGSSFNKVDQMSFLHIVDAQTLLFGPHD